MTPTRFELAHLTIVETSAKSEEELTTLESTALDQLGHSVYLLKVENTWFSGLITHPPPNVKIFIKISNNFHQIISVSHQNRN